MGSYETGYPPYNPRPASEVGKIICRVNPEAVFVKDITDADYVVPPGAMVFAPIYNDESRMARFQTRARAISRKRCAEDDCLDVIANAYDIQKRTLKHKLRFVGVALEGILNGRDARRHPDARGRFSVLVAGETSIIVNKEQTKRFVIGDELHFSQVDNGMIYNGFPRNWSTFAVQTGRGGKGGALVAAALMATQLDGKHRIRQQSSYDRAVAWANVYNGATTKTDFSNLQQSVPPRSPLWAQILPATITFPGMKIDSTSSVIKKASVAANDTVCPVELVLDDTTDTYQKFAPRKRDEFLALVASPRRPSDVESRDIWDAIHGNLSPERRFALTYGASGPTPAPVTEFLNTMTTKETYDPYPYPVTIALLRHKWITAGSSGDYNVSKAKPDIGPDNVNALDCLAYALRGSGMMPGLSMTTKADGTEIDKDLRANLTGSPPSFTSAAEILAEMTTPSRPIGVVLEASAFHNECRIKLM